METFPVDIFVQTIHNLLQQDPKILSHSQKLEGYLLDYLPEYSQEIRRFVFISFAEDLMGICRQNQEFTRVRHIKMLSAHFSVVLLESVQNVWMQVFGYAMPPKIHYTKNQEPFSPKETIEVTGEISMVRITKGEFVMGALSLDKRALAVEKPPHKVVISEDFLMAIYPCTQELFSAIMKSNPSRFLGNRHPVERVSWFDAVLFCNALSKQHGFSEVYKISEEQQPSSAWGAKTVPPTVSLVPEANGYRLPTEAQWEYAARAGSTHIYAGSHLVDDVGWFVGNSSNTPHPVGTKKANEWGLFDMSGNVWEWTFDVWARPYGQETKNIPQDPVHDEGNQQVRVHRGGAWSSRDGELRISNRSGTYASNKSSSIGFRCIRMYV